MLIILGVVALLSAAACAPPAGSKGRGKGPRATTTVPARTVPVPTAPMVVRPVTFPVVGPVTWSDTFGAPRSGGRTHEGQDLMGAKGLALVAAADGVLTTVRHSSSGLSGNMLRLTDSEGWVYVYIHLNNDRPGTDDAANLFEHAFADGVVQGQRVKAGEPIGYLGDSGNAEETGAHLHFEIRQPDGVVINAAASLRAAATNSLSADQIAAAAPVGSFDSASVPAANMVRVSGWVLDAVVDDPAQVSVYVNGNPFVNAPANQARPDVVAAYPGRAGDHGFTIDVPGIASGTHRFCVIAHNAGAGGGGRRLGCLDVTV